MSVEERNREYAERAARDARRKQELAFLGLTTREYHAVMQAGVNGVADFSMKSVLDLLKVQQVGKITVQGICKKLEVNGIRLSGPYFHELPEKQTPEQRCRAMDREVEALHAEVERLRKDAELERVMQRAAVELPDGWEIRICVERGAGWVDLFNPEGDEIADTWSGQETLSDEVSEAVDTAKEASR
ncbi:hypothetical protein SAMN04244573_02470 [Azotobacter beijerinckii]|uniref:RNA polymerase alpha subunit C-terminal domain-containing protein n=1 Tax=Azotobacter beijerinckii TaxID=170623 RepID=A0A1H9JSD7_9GAMM|nr:DNA-directed RNA polymerase subunit alpha C-terminal domain-containing protein [Azotobacter beijerinckii]SEQ89719.1 hypothetical protein SAMN04244573_02470 [Azotobacter beijerinckii]